MACIGAGASTRQGPWLVQGLGIVRGRGDGLNSCIGAGVSTGQGPWLVLGMGQVLSRGHGLYRG
jgi:hypothetical protein